MHVAFDSAIWGSNQQQEHYTLYYYYKCMASATGLITITDCHSKGLVTCIGYCSAF